MSRRTSNPATRRNQRGADAETLCRCGKPTRDDASICDPCLDDLEAHLAELVPSVAITTAGVRPEITSLTRVTVVRRDGVQVGSVQWCPWPRPLEQDPGLWAALQSVIAGERGIDYRTVGGSTGGTVETGLVLHETAVRRADDLKAALRRLVTFCATHQVQHHAPEGWQPRSTALVPAMAEWLAWRVPGLAQRPDAAEFPDEIRRVVEAARKTVMPARTHQDLGDCLVEGCPGRITADRDDTFATCDRCGAWVEAQQLRDWLIDDLEYRLVTAAEAAHLSTYLGLRADRDRVRARINAWVHRRRLIDDRVIEWTPGVCPYPPPRDLRFRFGAIYDLLLDTENTYPARSTA